MKTIACILSYKMAECVEDTVMSLDKQGWSHGEDLFVFENQAKETAEDHNFFVTHYTGENLRMGGGWNYIADYLRGMCDRIWFCTDFKVVHGSPSPRVLENVPANIGWYHPVITDPGHADYCFPWMMRVNPAGYRDVKMTDSICPLITMECMERLRENNNGNVFDKAFWRGWGLDYDTCWQIRQMAKRVVLHDAITVDHSAFGSYDAGVAPESKDTFRSLAHRAMTKRLSEKYGTDWHRKIMA